MRLGGLEGPALFGIEDGYVCEAAAGQRSAAGEIEDSGGAGGEKFDDARQRNFVLAMKVCNGERQRGFEPGDTEGGALEFHLLFVGGVRSVVGGDGVDGAVG